MINENTFAKYIWGAGKAGLGEKHESNYLDKKETHFSGQAAYTFQQQIPTRLMIRLAVADIQGKKRGSRN